MLTPQLKRMSLSLMGFFAFIVITTRIGFLLNMPISKFTIWGSLCAFVVFLILTLKRAAFKTVILFLLIICILGGVSLLLSKTYDTSWDGQGYHQSAVIALSQGWNPLYQSEIEFEQKLPSQIFAESYPSALWEVQANIYSAVGLVNSAKVVNFAISIVSLCVVYVLLRRLALGRITSTLVSMLVVFQPLYIIQFLSFMQDGFGYQLIVIAAASLIYFALDTKSYWSLALFVLSEIFLASTKYSHLPVVLMLGIIFAAMTANRFLNKEYLLNRKTLQLVAGVAVVAAIFAYIPYGRNIIFHHAAFYPTNIPELSGSVTYNNLPHNLQGKDKFTQFFYGIFSSSQPIESSDNRSPVNLAQLKIPFTFSKRELTDAAILYNNRAGAEGPLFSGVLLLALLFSIIMSFKAETMTQRYAFYGSYFCVGFVILASLMVPTPNLIRYTSQTQLLPFILFVPVLALFKNIGVKIVAAVLILLLIVNNTLYGAFVVTKTIDEENHISEQFTQMRNSRKTYQVRAQQFYSNYVLLNEQQVSFEMVERLHCNNAQKLYASSTTTEYCNN